MASHYASQDRGVPIVGRGPSYIPGTHPLYALLAKERAEEARLRAERARLQAAMGTAPRKRRRRRREPEFDVTTLRNRKGRIR